MSDNKNIKPIDKEYLKEQLTNYTNSVVFPICTTEKKDINEKIDKVSKEIDEGDKLLREEISKLINEDTILHNKIKGLTKSNVELGNVKNLPVDDKNGNVYITDTGLTSKLNEFKLKEIDETIKYEYHNVIKEVEQDIANDLNNIVEEEVIKKVDNKFSEVDTTLENKLQKFEQDITNISNSKYSTFYQEFVSKIFVVI